jgi:hypothetical protein
MIDLTPEDEALLARARAGLEPRAEDQARIKRGLLMQIAAGTVAATAALSTSAEAAGTIQAVGSVAAGGVFSVLTKVVGVGILSAAIVGGGLVIAKRSTSQAPPSGVAASAGDAAPVPTFSSAPVPRSSDVVPAGSVEVQGSTGSTPTLGTGSATAAVDRARTSPPQARSTAGASAAVSSTEVASSPGVPRGPSTLEAEAELLRRAGAALNAGDPAQALHLIGQHAASFPNGVLIEEREAERVVVLCALGRVSDARAAGAAFLRDRPRSPMAERVRASCGAP